MTDQASPVDGSGVMAPPLLSVAGVSKRFGSFVAIDDLSLDLRAGEFFALLGPSGCGKTTLLRMLAGFEAPDRGRILLDGQEIGALLPHRRPINMMFQNYALFPHLTVRLEGFEARKPDQLSGGQRQRVALARALALRPRILLLDEPMAALDKKLRQSTQAELIDLQRRLGTTFVIVTHDQEEAMTVADRIGVMDRGRLVQVGAPRDLYETPASRWIAGFVGDINLIEGRVVSRDHARLTVATSDAGSDLVAEAPRSGSTAAPAAEICIAVRPEKMRLARVTTDTTGDVVNRLTGEVIDVSYQGGSSSYRIGVASGLVLRVSLANASRSGSDDPAPGQTVIVSFAPEDCVVLER
jgi:putrescine transport system ATP-binding protein